MVAVRRLAFVLFASSVACAQVLGYDDYRARQGEDRVEIDSAIEDTYVDTFVEEVGGDAEDSGPAPHRIPARPEGAATPSGGKTLWLGVRTYRLGAVDPDGLGSDEEAWKTNGYDLDELCTDSRASVENIGTCQRPEGAMQDSLIDGDGCRDNNFGRHVGTLIRVSAPDSEKTLNEAVANGSSTWILRLLDVDASGDDAYAPGALYRASDLRALGEVMKWDGTDERPVVRDSVLDDDLARPLISFPNAYIRDSVWVSGAPHKLVLTVPVTASIFITMPLESAVLTLSLNDARDNGVHGVIAGVVPASEMETLLKPIADNAGICPGTSLYKTMLNQASRMPDVVIGAPKLQDTTRRCDGVSAGMSFEVGPVKPPTELVDPPPPRALRCGDDAGT
jgi:hypothetical protein